MNWSLKRPMRHCACRWSLKSALGRIGKRRIRDASSNREKLKGKPQTCLRDTKPDNPFDKRNLIFDHSLRNSGPLPSSFGSKRSFHGYEPGIHARELGIKALFHRCEFGIYARKLGIHILA